MQEINLLKNLSVEPVKSYGSFVTFIFHHLGEITIIANLYDCRLFDEEEICQLYNEIRSNKKRRREHLLFI